MDNVMNAIVMANMAKAKEAALAAKHSEERAMLSVSELPDDIGENTKHVLMRMGIFNLEDLGRHGRNETVALVQSFVEKRKLQLLFDRIEEAKAAKADAEKVVIEATTQVTVRNNRQHWKDVKAKSAVTLDDEGE